MTVPGMPVWALPDPAPRAPAGPPPVIDPPFIQAMADGTIVALPMSYDWGQGYNVTGGWDDATQVNQALLLAQRNGQGGRVRLAPATYNTKTAIAVPFNCLLQGHLGGTVISFSGSGDCVRMNNPTNPAGFASPLSFPAGGIRDLIIDGTLSSAVADSFGLHLGDGWGFLLDNLWIRNFANTAGSIGYWEDNFLFWTEKLTARAIHLWNNSTGWKADQTTGKPSHEFNTYDFHIKCMANQTALWVTNGAFLSMCRLSLQGNFIAGLQGGANTGICLRIGNGTNTTGSKINLSRVEITVEADQNNPGDVNFHQTLNMDTDTTLQQCWGALNFNPVGALGWVPANFNTATATRMAFAGVINGDPNLSSSGTVGAGGQPALALAGSPLIYPPASFSGATLKTGNGDFFKQTITANIVVDLTGGAAAGCVPGPQVKVIMITQDGVGGRTVTWPHPGVPSITSPTVLWAGGAAPVQTAAAGATDVYRLTTFDGITWIGQRLAANIS